MGSCPTATFNSLSEIPSRTGATTPIAEISRTPGVAPESATVSLDEAHILDRPSVVALRAERVWGCCDGWDEACDARPWPRSICPVALDRCDHQMGYATPAAATLSANNPSTSRPLRDRWIVTSMIRLRLNNVPRTQTLRDKHQSAGPDNRNQDPVPRT